MHLRISRGAALTTEFFCKALQQVCLPVGLCVCVRVCVCARVCVPECTLARCLTSCIRMNKFTEAWQDEGHLIASGLSTTLHACRPTAGKPLAVQARVHAHTSSRAHTHTQTHKRTSHPPTCTLALLRWLGALLLLRAACAPTQRSPRYTHEQHRASSTHPSCRRVLPELVRAPFPRPNQLLRDA